jgi:hypothetical protein
VGAAVHGDFAAWLLSIRWWLLRLRYGAGGERQP